MVAATASWPPVRWEERLWAPDPGNRGRRADRELGTFRSAVVPAIAGVNPALTAATSAALEAAEEAVASLQGRGGPDLAALSGALLRSESVASSRIEYLSAAHQDVALAVLGIATRDSARAGPAARAMAANMSAMVRALEVGASHRTVTVQDVLDVHRVLMESDRLAAVEAGKVRRVQNWVGGSDYSPRDALFVPPDPRHLPTGLEDLAAFSNRADLSPIALAAVAHAHFETLHPFVDGNGRTGRALVHMLWRRTGFAAVAVVPVSTVLLADVGAYFQGLQDYREGNVDGWTAQFAVATARAAHAGADLAQQVQALHARWVEEIHPRRGSALQSLLDLVLTNPVIDIADVRAAVPRAASNLYRALERLTQAGVLTEITDQHRNQVWVAADVFDLLERFEKGLGRRSRPGMRP